MRLNLWKVSTSVLFAAAILFASSAFADTITITTCNGCSPAGPYGTVDLTQSGSNVTVDITAASGFSFKTRDGSDIFFNISGVTLTSSDISAITTDNPTLTTTDFGFTTKNVDGIGSYSVDLTGIGTGDSNFDSIASVGSYHFTIFGVTLAEVEAENSLGFTWGVHICAADPSSCSPNTFFAGGGPPNGPPPPPPPVPEPGSLVLLGSGLLGLGSIVRRRIRR